MCNAFYFSAPFVPPNPPDHVVVFVFLSFCPSFPSSLVFSILFSMLLKRNGSIIHRKAFSLSACALDVDIQSFGLYNCTFVSFILFFFHLTKCQKGSSPVFTLLPFLQTSLCQFCSFHRIVSLKRLFKVDFCNVCIYPNMAQVYVNRVMTVYSMALFTYAVWINK